MVDSVGVSSLTGARHSTSSPGWKAPAATHFWMSSSLHAAFPHSRFVLCGRDSEKQDKGDQSGLWRTGEMGTEERPKNKKMGNEMLATNPHPWSPLSDLACRRLPPTMASHSHPFFPPSFVRRSEQRGGALVLLRWRAVRTAVRREYVRGCSLQLALDSKVTAALASGDAGRDREREETRRSLTMIPSIDV